MEDAYDGRLSDSVRVYMHAELELTTLNRGELNRLALASGSQPELRTGLKNNKNKNTRNKKIKRSKKRKSKRKK
jgi:hypothetical protein